MKNSKKSPSTLQKVLKYIGKYKYLLPVSIFLALITVALSLIVPILIGRAIDLMIGKGAVDIDGVVKILILTAVLVGIGALTQWLMSAINNRITFNVARDVRRDAFAKIERLPLSYLDSHPHGDILSRVIKRGLLMSGRSCQLMIELVDKPGQLKDVARIIADLGGNVTSVHHERANEGSDVNGCYLRIILETKNYDHIEEIKKGLVREGFKLI